MIWQNRRADVTWGITQRVNPWAEYPLWAARLFQLGLQLRGLHGGPSALGSADSDASILSQVSQPASQAGRCCRIAVLGGYHQPSSRAHRWPNQGDPKNLHQTGCVKTGGRADGGSEHTGVTANAGAPGACCDREKGMAGCASQERRDQSRGRRAASANRARARARGVWCGGLCNLRGMFPGWSQRSRMTA